MPPKSTLAAVPAESTKKIADAFTLARSIYNQRRKLREKADRLLADAPARVKAIVESIEVEEAAEPPLTPISPMAAGE